MLYINNTSKKLVGRNNQPTQPLVFDYECIIDLTFQFIDFQQKIQPLENLSGLYLAGGLIGKNDTIGEVIFLSEDYTISSDILTFTTDTYTEQYLSGVTKKYTPINIEIGQYLENGAKQVLLRDTALACPRVRVQGFDPTDIDLSDYYTKEEIDAKLADIPGMVIDQTLDVESTNAIANAAVAQAVDTLSGEITYAPVTALSGASGTVSPRKHIFYHT